MLYNLKNRYHTPIGINTIEAGIKKTLFYVVVLCSILQMSSQTKISEASKEDAIQAALHLSQGALAIENNEFIKGEVAYRKAISIEEDKATGRYNLGNAYYKNSKNQEALSRFVGAAKVANTKPQRHKAFHNLGNALMNQKEYSGAVEAYKNALRNNPADDKTRYNLALAKELLEKNPPQESEDDKEQDNQEQQEQDKTNKIKKITSKIKIKKKILKTTKIQRMIKGIRRMTRSLHKNLKMRKTNKTLKKIKPLTASCLLNR